MTASMDPAQTAVRRITYVLIGAIFLVLTIIALVAFRSARSTADAEEKADRLIAAFDQAGYSTPSKDQVVRVLGDDGGAVCADPNSALRRSVVHGMLTNGAAGPGIRPVIADNNVLKGQLLVIQTYCPDELPEFTEFAENLQLDDVAKE